MGGAPADMARVLGIHPQTLRKLRRSQKNLFKEGRDYRWIGLSTSSHLQWYVHTACRSYTEYQRLPAERVEIYRRAIGVRARS